MKTLSDLFPSGGFHCPTDFIEDNGVVDNDTLAYHLLCQLRRMPGALAAQGPDQTGEAVKMIREYFEATSNASRGKLK